MNLQQWSFLAEIFASIAVVFSLCFLAYEIHLHARQARQDSMDLVTSSRHDLLRILAEDGELAAIVWKGLAGTPRIPAHEWARFSMYLYTLLLELERTWLKVNAGALNAEDLENSERAMVWWFQHPGARAWWRGENPGLDADFMAYIDDSLTRIKVNPLIATAVAAAFREQERPGSGIRTAPMTVAPEVAPAAGSVCADPSPTAGSALAAVPRPRGAGQDT